MAQTKKKRRRKHRGTQGGGISTRPKGRPRNRAEARARAQARRSGAGAKGRAPTRGIVPPTWSSAFKKGLVAGVLFFVILALVFKEPVPQSAALAAFMLLFYVPMGYFTDKLFYQRNMRKQQRERQAQQSGNGA